MRNLKSRIGAMAVLVTISLTSMAAAQRPKTLDLGLQPIQSSDAYQQFMNRPLSERSKLQYLIDRFKNLQVEINYDGHLYKPRQVAGLVQMFLAMHFDKKETAKEWILKYCNRTVNANNPIWFKSSDGKVHQSGEILIDELSQLETLIPSMPVF